MCDAVRKVQGELDMIKWFINRWYHIHDYDMEFPYEGTRAMRYVLRCTKCGDTVLDMGEAVTRTQNSRIRCWTFLIGGWTLFAANVAWLLWGRR